VIQDKIIWAFFLTGVYHAETTFEDSNMPQTSYISDAKPYYVLLFLLMIEKFSI
jgi:hypothetical protein